MKKVGNSVDVGIIVKFDEYCPGLSTIPLIKNSMDEVSGFQSDGDMSN